MKLITTTDDALILFFLQIGVMLTTAVVFGQLMRKIHQPAVLGELIGGVILGPTIFGLIFPETYIWLFPVDAVVTSWRKAVIKIGMLFFLFVAGLEINPAYLRQKGFSVVLTSVFGSVIPFGLGFGATLLFPTLWDIQSKDQGLTLAFFMGTALSISALPVIARILSDLGLLHQEAGAVVMAAATVSDIIGWALFAMILSTLAQNGQQANLPVILGLVLAFSAVVLAAGHWLGSPLLRWARRTLNWPSSFIGVVTVMILFAASLAETIGFHAIFGAFLLGIALRKGMGPAEKNQAHEIIYQFALSFFAPLYFVSVGLEVDFVANFDLPLVLVVLLIASLGKIAGASLGSRLGGAGWNESLLIGFGLNARGAMEIILASAALDYGLINQRIFVALVIMALATSMLSGPAMQRLARRGL